MPALHRNPLSLACLGDEIPDQLGWSRLRAPHDEITWCPKIARGIISLNLANSLNIFSEVCCRSMRIR